MLLLLFLPIYMLWQLGIGLVLSEKLNQKKSIVRITGYALVILSCWFSGLIYLAKLLLPSMSIDFNEMLPAMLTFFGLFFFQNAILTALTVKYEREQDDERYYGTADFRDYIWRFFAFFYWPFFIWSYQKKVNTYID